MMQLLDLLGRRWTLRVLWELRSGDPIPYAALREASTGCRRACSRPGCASWWTRDLVERDPSGAYSLTRDGVRLLEHLGPLDDFAKRWAG